MATMNKVIEQVDRLNPNVFTDDDKYGWISTMEGLVKREVYCEEDTEPLGVADADKELRIPFPYDDLYLMWVNAQIDLHNREYDEYNNKVMVFSDRYEQFRAWYIRHYVHGAEKNFRNVMG